MSSLCDVDKGHKITLSVRSRTPCPLSTRSCREPRLQGIDWSFYKEVPGRLTSLLGVGCWNWNGLSAAFAWAMLLFFHLFPLHLQQIHSQCRTLHKSVTYYYWIMYVSGILTVPYGFFNTKHLLNLWSNSMKVRCQARGFAVGNCCSPSGVTELHQPTVSQQLTLLCLPCSFPVSV